MDGANALQAIISGAKLDISVSASVIAVTANDEFQGVKDYEGAFQNQSIDFGSIKGSKVWSSSCRTYGIGYSYSLGGPAFRVCLPTFSRGSSYYTMLWASNK